MVKVTRMNGFDFVVNAELIEFIEATPDTVLTLTTGKKFVLKDTVEEVVNKVIEYRKTIGTKVIYNCLKESEKSLETCDE